MEDLAQNKGMSDIQHHLDALNKLVEVSLVMNSTLSEKPLLDYIMQAATDITGSEAASILLIDRNTKDLRFAASSGSNEEELAGIIVPQEGSIAGTIIKENRVIVIDDVANDPRHFRQADEQISFQTKSLLGVPMRIKDRMVGVLEVVNKPDRYTSDDVRHIMILASQAAVAIENAQLINELRTTQEDLERLNQLKSNFIAVASHELRTPLGVILGYASFLKDEAQGETSTHAQRVLDSAIHLRGLIEDMTNLRFLQIDEAQLTFNVASVKEIIEAAQIDVAGLAEAKEQALIIEPPRNLIQVNVDFEKIVMALTNIMNNAIKFTPSRGLIIVSVELRKDEAWIKVNDNGTGLPESELERIFTQFYQVEDPMTRHHGGLGLGLTISKAIVEEHGGRLWAESDGVEKGSSFYMSLPLA